MTDKLDTVELVRERLVEYAGDRFVPVRYFCGADAPISIRGGLSNLENGMREYLRLNTVMYYALMGKTTLDYFVAADYSKYTRIALYGAAANETVTDRYICQFVGWYLVLPQEAKDELAKTAIFLAWNR